MSFPGRDLPTSTGQWLMIFKHVKRMLTRHHKKRDATRLSDERSKAAAAECIPSAKHKAEWEEVLTASLKENALAPSEEVILHAFDLYCDELNAPFLERRHAMNGHLSEIVARFAKVQALAPDMVERAAAKHKLELHRFIDKKDDF